MDSKNVVVLAGAGASYAVNNDAFPTTKAFFELIEADLKADKLLARIIKHLRKHDEVVDLETLLWAIDAIADFCDRALDGNSVLGAILADDSVGEAVGRAGHASHVVALAERVRTVIRPLLDRLNARLYQHYATEPPEAEISRNWVPLLHGLLQRFGTVQVATTNYDFVIEAAIAKGSIDIDTGIRGEIRRFLDTDRYQVSGSSDMHRSILGKLHGSLNWVRRDDMIEIGDPSFHGRHELHGIIYPGFKGAPKDEPFLLLHDWLSRSLSTASAFITIGFAFRDLFLNEIIGSSMHPDCRVVVLDPAPSVVFPRPKLRTVRYVRRGFDEDAVNEILDLAEGKVNLTAKLVTSASVG